MNEAQIQLFELTVEYKQLKRAIRVLRNKRKLLAVKIRAIHLSGQKQMRLRTTAETKKCRKCNVEMVADCFYKDPRYTDGLYPYCRICKSDMGSANYLKRKKAA